MRWWDGRHWGQYAAAQQQPGLYPPPHAYMDASYASSRSTAALAHYLGILGFLGPLIILLTSGSRDMFVRTHTVEALNFHITYIIAWVIVGAINVATCGLAFPLAILLFVPMIIFAIQGGSAASRGQWFRYPMTIRMIT